MINKKNNKDLKSINISGVYEPLKIKFNFWDYGEGGTPGSSAIIIDEATKLVDNSKIGKRLISTINIPINAGGMSIYINSKNTDGRYIFPYDINGAVVRFRKDGLDKWMNGLIIRPLQIKGDSLFINDDNGGIELDITPSFFGEIDPNVKEIDIFCDVERFNHFLDSHDENNTIIANIINNTTDLSMLNIGFNDAPTNDYTMFIGTALTKTPRAIFDRRSTNAIRFTECTNLIEISQLLYFGSSYSNFEDAFAGCTSLRVVGKDLFNFDRKMKIRSLANCFRDCSSLENLGDFKIPTHFVVNSLESIYGMFENCVNLKYTNEYLFGTNPASYHADRVIDCRLCFNGCRNLQSLVPMWKKYPKSIGDGYARGCVSATNYSDVPDNWK